MAQVNAMFSAEDFPAIKQGQARQMYFAADVVSAFTTTSLTATVTYTRAFTAEPKLTLDVIAAQGYTVAHTRTADSTTTPVTWTGFVVTRPSGGLSGEKFAWTAVGPVN